MKEKNRLRLYVDYLGFNINIIYNKYLIILISKIINKI